MSAESPNRTRSQTRTNGPVTVTPQPVTDPTILDSVAGFINEVVPTAYNVPYDSKDQIQWAHFEQLDYDECTFIPNYNCDKILPPPLILVLAYTTGIQVWAVPANGEATEILSWRHGSVRILRLLPAPHRVGSSNVLDLFASKRPLIALCDTATPGTHFCSLSFLSLKTGEQVKLIKFKNPILDVLANRHSIVVTFSEKIAIFDAFTLEDRTTVTTCYLSPGLQPNPVTLGTRWMAYAEKKLNQSKRSSGGNEGEGIQSYTATVLHAAKSLGRGLRELGETVASSLTGNPNFKPGTSPNSPQAGGQLDVPQKGIVTILDIENSNVNNDKSIQYDPIVAHFTAHTEAIVCLQFDPSGLLLLTADKRGHDFHLFRIHPHPGGPSLAAVHHLYILHRGDTSARVQDMCFSPDSRWVTVSTLRGTTHVFPITPYGGNVGVRTHATPHVVNKMSRFHRSAGLTAEGRSNSPVSIFEAPINSHFPYHNPRFAPYPHPTVVQPLAQIRQPVYLQNIGSAPVRQHPGRQRLPSSSEDNIALRVVTCFAQARAWIDDQQIIRETPINKQQIKAVESLFIMSCHGILVQYDLEPHQASNIPKEKVCDDTSIELTVCAKAQWMLQRQQNTTDVPLPMSLDNLNFIAQNVPQYKKSKPDHNDDHWLSQVEIVTHAGPHRRLWMGPQFTFKTYTTVNGSPMSVAETQSLDLGRSKPVNMPITKANAVLIESSSASSCEQSLLDTYQKNYEEIGAIGELQLKEDLADAMLESPGIKETGGRCVIVSMKPTVVAKVVNPLGTVVTVQSDDETELEVSEDAVIHENCDEALFRPVIASKNIHYAELRTKPQRSDEIFTKSLESTTEVAVKILNKKEPVKINTRNKIQDISSSVNKKTKTRESPPKQKDSKLKDKSTKLDKINNEKENNKRTNTALIGDSNLLCDISDPYNDITDSVKKSESNEDDPILLGNAIKSSKDDFNFYLPPLENDDFFSLENISKGDNFEDARDCTNETFNKENKEFLCSKKEMQENSLIFASEEQPFEEKSLIKKIRKPKTKLGVKIGSVNKENVENTLNTSSLDKETTIPSSKRSWSSIAASKPAEKSLIDSTEKEKEDSLDLPTIESVENFTVTLPKQNYTSCIIMNDLIDINTPQEDKGEALEILPSDSDYTGEDLNLLKVSDDEKIDTGSSPAETTTESDDSSKLPKDLAISNGDDDNPSLIKVSQPASKSSKRKLKKKRK